MAKNQRKSTKINEKSWIIFIKWSKINENQRKILKSLQKMAENDQKFGLNQQKWAKTTKKLAKFEEENVKWGLRARVCLFTTGKTVKWLSIKISQLSLVWAKNCWMWITARPLVMSRPWPALNKYIKRYFHPVLLLYLYRFNYRRVIPWTT